MNYEEHLRKQIQTGEITDSEIKDIIDHGDRSLRRALDERADYLWKEKKYLNRAHGGDWDYKDEQGRLHKYVEIDNDFHKGHDEQAQDEYDQMTGRKFTT